MKCHEKMRLVLFILTSVVKIGYDILHYGVHNLQAQAKS
jgi:hypothetical protein